MFLELRARPVDLALKLVRGRVVLLDNRVDRRDCLHQRNAVRNVLHRPARQGDSLEWRFPLLQQGPMKRPKELRCVVKNRARFRDSRLVLAGQVVVKSGRVGKLNACKARPMSLDDLCRSIDLRLKRREGVVEVGLQCLAAFREQGPAAEPAHVGCVFARMKRKTALHPGTDFAVFRQFLQCLGDDGLLHDGIRSGCVFTKGRHRHRQSRYRILRLSIFLLAQPFLVRVPQERSLTGFLCQLIGGLFEAPLVVVVVLRAP